MEEEKLYCPFCGSSQLTANKKGFGAGKAIGGAILTGGVGLLAGFIGSGNVKITCLKCGHECKAGQLKAEPLKEEEKQGYYNYLRIMEEKKREEEASMSTSNKIGCWLLVIIVFVFIIITCS